jgi:hypothetical protein
MSFIFEIMTKFFKFLHYLQDFLTDLCRNLKILTEKSGTKNEICVSLVYSGNGNKISFTFPLYTRETQISFFVPEKNPDLYVNEKHYPADSGKIVDDPTNEWIFRGPFLSFSLYSSIPIFSVVWD